MPELQRFIWEWFSLLDRMTQLNPALGAHLDRAARPIAAERRPDGRLLLVLGCWVPADRAWLSDPDVLKMIEGGLKQFLDERINIIVMPWPAGDGAPDEPPDPLAGLPEAVRDVGLTCRGALRRSFFAAAARRGVVFDCQYPVLNYRLDFALPRRHIGVEVGGWSWRSWTQPRATERREREQSLSFEGWRIFWFTGEEILRNLGKSVDDVVRLANGQDR